MKQRIQYILQAAAFCLVLFITARIIFLIVYAGETKELVPVDYFLILWHGLKHDISLTGYMLLFPSLFLMILSWIPSKFHLNTLKIYWGIMLTIFSLVFIADLVLYKFWGFRLDNTPLMYLKKPKEAFASLNIIATILFLILIILLDYFLNKACWFNKQKYFPRINIRQILYTSLFFLLFILFLIIPIRGGLGKATLNAGSVYFHENNFANHAAINVLWNVGFSLMETKGQPKELEYFDSGYTEEILKPIYKNNTASDIRVLTIKQPNIILIIIESFTAKVIDPLNGLKGVTPNFNKACSEGILFNHFHATATRSDKGISAILSGFPSLSKETITMFPEKSSKLPNITKELRNKGYNTAFYYGGDINFAGLNSYLVNGGYQNMVDIKDFSKKAASSNWGVPDEKVFQRLFQDLQKKSNSKFFYTLFTLSNHEPFDIPVPHHFPGNDFDSRFLSTAYYTDSCIFDFTEKCKRAGIWDSTLFILVADHGSSLPGNHEHHDPMKFHIPMLWLGGVIKEPMIISQYGSQLDVPKTLLNQLGINANDFQFGHDIFLSEFDKTSFAIYTHNYGMGYIDYNTTYVFINNTDKYFYYRGKEDKIKKDRSLAFLQESVKFFNSF